MNPLYRIQHLWHQLMGPDLAAEHTAIVFHWPGDGPTARADQTFMLRGVLEGEALHKVLDPLIEEHVIRAYGTDEPAVTEVTIFWHRADGSWEMDELESRLFA